MGGLLQREAGCIDPCSGWLKCAGFLEHALGQAQPGFEVMAVVGFRPRFPRRSATAAAGERMPVTALRADGIWTGWIDDLVGAVQSTLVADVEHASRLSAVDDLVPPFGEKGSVEMPAFVAGKLEFSLHRHSLCNRLQ